MDFHRGAQHLADYRRFLGEFLSLDVNVGETVNSVFQEYRKDVGKSDPANTRRLLGDVYEWTDVEFGRDVKSQLSKMETMGPVGANRAWAILYCLRFMDDPDRTRGKTKYTRALGYAEQIERLILLQGRKGQRTYRSMNGGKGPPHPEDPHPDQPIDSDPNRLPARFFEFRPPENFQKERDEFREVRSALLEHNSRSVALVAAVMGPGGYGKTAIAEEIAIDPEIKRAFPGGIYWLQFGLRFGETQNAVEDYIGIEEAIGTLLTVQFDGVAHQNMDLSNPRKLFKALPSDRFLIIADDIWNTNQSAFLNDLPRHASVLISTRSTVIAKRTQKAIKITELDERMSFNLLTFGMGHLENDQDATLRALSANFRGWPLLLKLANGHFRKLKNEGGGIDDAIAEYTSFFERKNITGWDTKGAEDAASTSLRRELVRLCIDAGLKAILTGEQRRLFQALAVFPDDIDIPFDVIDQLWDELSLDEKPNNRASASALRLLANEYSLLRDISVGKKTLRLHDEMLSFFRGRTCPS